MLPERDRLSAWRELYGRSFLRLEHEPLTEVNFSVALEMRRLADIGLVTVKISPLRVGRTRELITDGNDAITFQMSSTPGIGRQLGREVEVAAGDALALSNADVGNFDFPLGSDVLALSLARRPLAAMVRDLDDLLMRAVPKNTEALWLLRSYLRILDDAAAPATPQVVELAAAHVCDLAALALGATRDGVALAASRGVRAARLAAAKEYTRAHLHRPELRIGAVAAHLGVTARYVHLLFEAENHSFSEWVLAERLARARGRLLTDPGIPITTIALEAGFSDLSYFNRTFRRRYDGTPTELRAELRRAPEAN